MVIFLFKAGDTTWQPVEIIIDNNHVGVLHIRQEYMDIFLDHYKPDRCLYSKDYKNIPGR